MENIEDFKVSVEKLRSEWIILKGGSEEVHKLDVVFRVLIDNLDIIIEEVQNKKEVN
jgi:hypothetical protein